jgi:hypothetical protein
MAFKATRNYPGCSVNSLTLADGKIDEGLVAANNTVKVVDDVQLASSSSDEVVIVVGDKKIQKMPRFQDIKFAGDDDDEEDDEYLGYISSDLESIVVPQSNSHMTSRVNVDEIV